MIEEEMMGLGSRKKEVSGEHGERSKRLVNMTEMVQF